MSETTDWADRMQNDAATEADLDPLVCALRLSRMYEVLGKALPDELLIPAMGMAVRHAASERIRIFPDEEPFDFADWLLLVHQQMKAYGVPVPPKGAEGLIRERKEQGE